ncbi:nuclear transport factor 2 family protein [Microbacterium timonense]|uniref:nuclear transport factor 2 family protein n=1 Tax=Microbacterium timonense TaxID=2086576 RepID=UPI000D0EF368|nr:nuclear transport factor 2 family protein [Microbacterium timonense]
MSDRESTIADAERWLGAYRQAWTTNDPDDIRAVFTGDAEYRAEPWAAPIQGHEAIVASWLERRDEPGTWTFDARVIAADGRLVFIEGETRYTSGTTYSNLWVVALADDGRATAFTEWWMDRANPS